MLTNATAVRLAAKAQSRLAGLANQIIFGAIYLGPAVLLPILINRVRGKESSDKSSEWPSVSRQ